MTKQLFINQLTKNQPVNEELFGINIVKHALDRNGKPYIDLELIDKTGTIKGKIWSDNLPYIDKSQLKEGNVVKITGTINEFNSKLQINITSLSKTEDFDLSDFISTTTKNIDLLMQDIQNTIDLIENPNLQNVLNEILQSHKDEIMKSPAAKSIHHNYIGGLVEHIVEMLKISDIVTKLYPEANKDIITAGIILHDIGKIYELEVNGFQINYTVKGKLLGHISLGLLLFHEIAKDKLEEKLYTQIEHIILSHHYTLEFGSPITPKTLEAVIVAKIDDLSSKARLVQKILKNNEDNDSNFAPREFGIDGQIYLG